MYSAGIKLVFVGCVTSGAKNDSNGPLSANHSRRGCQYSKWHLSTNQSREFNVTVKIVAYILSTIGTIRRQICSTKILLDHCLVAVE